MWYWISFQCNGGKVAEVAGVEQEYGEALERAVLGAADAAVDDLGDEDEPQDGRPDGQGGAPSPEIG